MITIPSQQRPLMLRPAQAFSGMAAHYAFGVASELNVDADMVACSMLSAICAAGLNRIEATLSKNYYVPGLLWMLVGAPSGAGKTPVFRRVHGVLEQVVKKCMEIPHEEKRQRELRRDVLSQRLKELRRRAGRSSSDNREEVHAEMFTCQREYEALMIPVSPLVDRVSMYAFVEEMAARNGAMAALGAEGALLPEWYSVGTELLQPIMKSWSGEPVSYTSKKKGSFSVERPNLHIGVGWQVAEARRLLLSKRFRPLGLGARFLYYEVLPYASTAAVVSSGIVPDEVENWWKSQLNLCCSYSSGLGSGKVMQLDLTEDAKHYLKCCKEQWVAMRFGFQGCEDFISKAESHAVRLAIALHCLHADIRMAQTIDADLIRRACALVNFYIDQLARVMYREKDAKIREIAFKVCQSFARAQVGQLQPGVCFGIRALAIQLNVSQKSLLQSMCWMAERGLVCPVNIPVNPTKFEPGWQALQFLGCFQDLDALP
jgi:hypothetical protein